MTKRKRKTILISVLASAMVFSLSACGKTGSGQNTSASGIQDNSVAEITDAGDTGAGDNGAESNAVESSLAKQDGNKILIAYFTAAENSGVDAVSSASYTTINGEAVGRIRAVADMIQERTGGELFSIRTSTVYPADGGALIDQAADEQGENFRPELTSHIENFDDYDVYFVGFAGGIIGLNQEKPINQGFALV